MSGHNVRRTGSTHDVDANTLRQRFECEDCDLSGIVAGSPAASIDQFVTEAIEWHQRQTGGCTCPDVDTTTWAELGRGERSCVRGYGTDCPVHGLWGTEAKATHWRDT